MKNDPVAFQSLGDIGMSLIGEWGQQYRAMINKMDLGGSAEGSIPLGNHVSKGFGQCPRRFHPGRPAAHDHEVQRTSIDELRALHC